MVNLELVYCRLVTGNKKSETVIAMSTSYSALKDYCMKTFKKKVKDSEHFTDDHYIIRSSEVIIIRENFNKFNTN